MTAMNPLNPPGTPTSPAVQAAFEDFARELNLDGDERRDARERLTEITQHLVDEGVIADFFLQGSLARRTMISPLRDIDAVVILSPEHEHLRHEGEGAHRAAGLVGDVLRRQYPNAAHDRSRHSVKLDLGEDTFSFDVVPAFESLDASDDVEIMDLDRGAWSSSNSRELIRVVAERDTWCDGAFVQQVRFVKHFVRRELGTDFPGLHVEAIAYGSVTERLGHAEAVEMIILAGARLLGPLQSYSDPTGRERLDVKLDTGVRERARQVFEGAARRVGDAMDQALEGRDEQAISIFAGLFGEPFPKRTAPRPVRRLAPGAATAAALRAVEPPTPTARAWRAT